MTALTLLLVYLALAALAFAMPRHHRLVFAQEASPRHHRTWRGVGWSLVAASVAPPLATLGPEVGTVQWFAAVPTAGLALTFVLAVRPRWWPAPAVGLLVLALAA